MSLWCVKCRKIFPFSVEKARDDTRTASRLADSADASAKRVRKQHEITMLNLKELKDKILLARQKASSVSNMRI